MLRALRVADLAIIDEIELVLEPGFNVLTGETGAGKSILLHALDLALGGKPEVDVVRAGAEEAVVEALFTDVPEGARAALAAAGLAQDVGDELVIRRVIASGGRTRAYVNGQLTTLAILRELAPQLLRVYGQDEHQALRRVESHRELLDQVGGLGSTVDEMRRRHARLVVARQALAERRAAIAAAKEREDLLRFQLQELEQAQLQPNELETLQADRVRLAHAEKLGQLAGAAETALYSGEGAMVDALGRVLASLRDAEKLDAGIALVRTLLDTVQAELEDAGAQLGRYVRGLAPDPARLEALEERLALLARLQRKYGGDVAALLAKRDALRAELDAAGEGEEALGALAAEAEAAEREATAWAKRLSVERRRVASSLERSLVGELRRLALEGARFQVRFAEGDARPLAAAGWDDVEFWLAANPGEDFRPLARVASGGELSRIMLALKTLTAAEDRGATLIFDEVDSGVGGGVAEVIGRKLRQLGRRRQVLSVTHLPVIAAFAEHHVLVAKRVIEGRTVSTATALGSGERVVELARMLGGARLTREARQHAEELLQSAAVAARGSGAAA